MWALEAEERGLLWPSLLPVKYGYSLPRNIGLDAIVRAHSAPKKITFKGGDNCLLWLQLRIFIRTTPYVSKGFRFVIIRLLNTWNEGLQIFPSISVPCAVLVMYDLRILTASRLN